MLSYYHKDDGPELHSGLYLGYVEINDKNCPKDSAVEEVIEGFKSQTDIKYNRVITRFGRQLTHPGRLQETELGDLFSDVLTESLGAIG